MIWSNKRPVEGNPLEFLIQTQVTDTLSYDHVLTILMMKERFWWCFGSWKILKLRLDNFCIFCWHLARAVGVLRVVVCEDREDTDLRDEREEGIWSCWLFSKLCKSVSTNCDEGGTCQGPIQVVRCQGPHPGLTALLPGFKLLSWYHRYLSDLHNICFARRFHTKLSGLFTFPLWSFQTKHLPST